MDFFHFAAVSNGLDIREKMKLVLFAAGVKQNAYIVLKINSENLEDQYTFEELLKQNSIVYHKSRAKSYETIKQIKGNAVIWGLEGTWISYDLFVDKESEKVFKHYINSLTKSKHNRADKWAGKLYDYPSCCTKQFIKEHDPKYLIKNFSCYEYYKKIHDVERKFPWVFHKPHSTTCEATSKLNRIYKKIIKENKESVWKEYDKKEVHKTDLIVGGISDIKIDDKSIWPSKNGYEYELIIKRPYDGKYYLISYLSKKIYALGQILEGEVTFQHNYADVVIKRERRQPIDGLHHERKLPLLGRKF